MTRLHACGGRSPGSTVLAWGWQDFPAGTITTMSVTLTANINGTSVVFDPANVISNSAVVVSANDPSSFVYSGYFRLISTKVAMTTHTAATVNLNAVPDASWGPVRIYYMYQYSFPLPADFAVAPKFIQSTVVTELDNLFVSEEQRGNLTEATSNVLVFSSGASGGVIGNWTVRVQQAGASQSGYLSYADWARIGSGSTSAPSGGGSIGGSGVASQVAFWSGSTNLAGDPGLTYLSSGTRLGIGLTNPIEMLSTAGNLSLPATGASVGQVWLGGARFMHGYGSVGNIFIGPGAGNVTQTANYNVGIGRQALGGVSSGGQNTVIGYQAGASLGTGTANVAIGDSALTAAQDATNNVCIGSGVGSKLWSVTASNNVLIGYNVATGASGAQNTVAIGSGACQALTTGTLNTAIGYQAMTAAQNAGSNTMVGYVAGTAITSGGSNTGLGLGAVSQNQVNSRNTGCGAYALQNTKANENVGIGYYAGKACVTGEQSVYIGWQSGLNEKGGYNTVVGANAGSQSAATLMFSLALGWGAQPTASGYAAIGAAAGSSGELMTMFGELTPGSTHRIRCNGPAAFGALGATNFSEFEGDGTLVFKGAATVWRDQIIPGTGMRAGTANAPDLVNFVDANIMQLGFDGTGGADRVYGAFELQHDYKPGTTLEVHVHWSNPTASTLAVVWQMYYSIQGQSLGVYSAGITLSTSAFSAGTTAWQHNYSSLGYIAGASIGIGTIMPFTLMRDSTSALDTYNNDAVLLSVGMHYECDTVGSRTMLSK